MNADAAADTVRDLLSACRLLLHVIEVNQLDPVDGNCWSIRERAEQAITKASDVLEDDELATVSIDSFTDSIEPGLQMRVYNCLTNEGIKTLRDLLQRSPRDLLKIKNLGLKSVNQIIGALAARNLTLPGRSRRA